MTEHSPCVYIAATRHGGPLRVGVLPSHAAGPGDATPIYFELAATMEAAIARQRQLAALLPN